MAAQDSVEAARAAYEKALGHRAGTIREANAGGLTKYRIAKVIGVTRRVVDEALVRAASEDP